MKPVLIARQKECEQLADSLKSNRSEFVIVCGRRRIGKTFLIDQFFKNEYDFTFVGAHKAKTATQLRNFAKAIRQHSGKKPSPFSDWYDAFDALEEYLGSLPADRKKVIFIDEMPWIDTSRSTFVEALENFWNGWANRRYDIILIASGSATSWMADNLLENQGGLHNRITRRIYLEPFTLGETEEYFEQAYQFISGLDVTQLHVFSYSERPGTQALKIDYVVSPEEKHQRSQRLLTLSDEKTRAFYTRHIGQTMQVLMEKSKAGTPMHGFTANYIRVEVENDESLDNQMINVRLGEFNEDMTALKGTILMNYEV